MCLQKRILKNSRNGLIESRFDIENLNYTLEDGILAVEDDNENYIDIDLDDIETGIYFIPSKWVAAFCCGLKNVHYFFMPIPVAEKASKNLDSLLDQIAGKGYPAEIPEEMIWVGENEGKTTRQVLKNLQTRR